MDRGEIYHVDLNPILGREQSGARFVLVVSTAAFNQLGTQFVCPITQGGNYARNSGFAVSLIGTGGKTGGVVLCNQLRSLDLRARNARFIERVPEFIVGEVIAKISAILE